MLKEKKRERFIALDYLRGFFIIVIIVDHLARWPSLFEGITGRGELWANAAMGFVILSGLMVGYIRGFKSQSLPMKTVAKKLLSRALLLYFWVCVCSIFYASLGWYLTTVGSRLWVPVAPFNWSDLVHVAVTLNYTHIWVHFLYLYAIFLALAPLAIYLLRKQAAWVVAGLSIIGYIVGLSLESNWLQWQPFFFLAMIIGFYLNNILDWWKSLHTKARTILTRTLFAVVAISIVASIFTSPWISIFPTPPQISLLFSKNPLAAAPIILSFIWFAAFVLLFIKYRAFLQKYLGWLLLPLGTRSLTAYITHGIVIALLMTLLPFPTNALINTAVGVIAVLSTWVIIRIPLVQKIIPR